MATHAALGSQALTPSIRRNCCAMGAGQAANAIGMGVFERGQFDSRDPALSQHGKSAVKASALPLLVAASLFNLPSGVVIVARRPPISTLLFSQGLNPGPPGLGLPFPLPLDRLAPSVAGFVKALPGALRTRPTRVADNVEPAEDPDAKED